MSIRSRDAHTERRKIPRRPLIESAQQRASIDFGDGSPHRDCLICDISQKGARIVLAGANDIPNEFRLMLGGGGAHRRCHVLWRTDRQVGVEFFAEPKDATD